MNDRYKLRWPLLKDRTNKFIKFVYGDCFVGKPFDPPTKHFGEPQQCTGLKDKNGNLIYEGDFLKDHNGIWQVLWDEKEAAFYIYNKKRDFYLSPFIGEFEIIGNIHENKELLK